MVVIQTAHGDALPVSYQLPSYKAVLAAVVREIDGPINIGNGRATNFTGLARLVTEARGYSPELRYEVDKPAGARYRVANTTHLNTFYEPQVTLEEGIARALQGV